MRRLPLLAVLPLALLLSGCFQIFSTLTVRADGSAQLVEQITAEGAMAMGLMAMGEMPGGATSFETRASTLGEGITVASVEETFAPGAVTYLVTYDVADVNTLVYSLSDAVDPDALGESVMGGGMMGGTEDPSMEGMTPCDPDVEDCEGRRSEDLGGDAAIEDEVEDPPYRFAFTPGSGGRPASLVVTVPEGAVGPGDLDGPPTGGGETEEDSFNQMLVLLGTMSMQFDVVVDGALVEADHGWTDGNRVTLSQIQMGELLEYARDEMADGDIQAFIEAQGATADVELPGLRAVAPGTVTVRFQ